MQAVPAGWRHSPRARTRTRQAPPHGPWQRPSSGQAVDPGYRWLVEKDLTYHVPGAETGNPAPDSNTLAVGFHRSYMPVVAKGTEANTSIDVSAFRLASTTNPADNQASDYFYVSVLPNTGYSIGGAAFKYDDPTVTVYVNANPIPTAQIIVFVHEDISPINMTPEAIPSAMASKAVPAGATYEPNVSQILAMGARSVAVDFLFVEPDRLSLSSIREQYQAAASSS